MIGRTWCWYTGKGTVLWERLCTMRVRVRVRVREREGERDQMPNTLHTHVYGLTPAHHSYHGSPVLPSPPALPSLLLPPPVPLPPPLHNPSVPSHEMLRLRLELEKTYRPGASEVTIYSPKNTEVISLPFEREQGAKVRSHSLTHSLYCTEGTEAVCEVCEWMCGGGKVRG